LRLEQLLGQRVEVARLVLHVAGLFVQPLNLLAALCAVRGRQQQLAMRTGSADRQVPGKCWVLDCGSVWQQCTHSQLKFCALACSK
jgi:hypothetical protein